ncbi:MAG: DUF3987 domain-containing protein [Lysobacter sp.]|nr:MAG: DUF3987 domain-containing protein [Lysobacter sp.]
MSADTTASPRRETPEQAARRLGVARLRQGFLLQAVYAYCAADGEILFWRVRMKHPNGKKHIPAMHWDGTRFLPGEPAFPAGMKPVYRLPELLASRGPIYYVEGENKVDALLARGVIATTSGSATSARGVDWSHAQGRDAVVFRDYDTAGLGYARDVTRALQACGAASIAWIDVAALGVPESGDVIDWFEAHPEAGAAELDALPRLPAPHLGDAAVIPQRPAPPKRVPVAPEPLYRPPLRAAAYPLHALGSVLGGAARRIREVVQSPDALCGQSLLSAASLAVQSLADVEIDGRREPLSLWCVSIGDSGERKSATDAASLRAHRERERALADDHRTESAAYEAEASVYKAAVRKIESKGDAAEIRAARKALGAPPQRPLDPWLLLGEPTLEGLHRVYQRGRPSIGLFNDDAGDFLNGHAMGRDNRAKSAAGLSRLWDCGEFSRVRAGEGVAKCYGRRLAMHVMVQPVIAERVLSDDLLVRQGFLARCLLAWPDSTIGTRRYVSEDLAADPALHAYWQCMHARLGLPAALRTGARNELSPRVLTLTPQAKNAWIDLADGIEAQMAVRFVDVKAWAGKAASQALRIAGVLTLIDDAHAEIIERETLERASALVNYHLHEAARIVGTAHVPERIKDADALIGWCRQTGREYLYSADALRRGPSALRTREAFLAAMTLLESAGWVERMASGSVLDGKPRGRVWRLRTEVLAS